MTAANLTNDTTDREISATRVYDAPRDLVWKMWTDQHHIAQWWGPKGFTNTIQAMDVRPGGKWSFVMHGPDGRDYKNEIVYTEVVPQERIAYDHVSGPLFHATVDFRDAGADKTELRMKMVFESAGIRNRVAEEYGAVEGLQQTLGRLADELASGDFVVTRLFDAPRELVWKAWTEVDRLKQWFGPKGFTMSAAKGEMREGSTFLYALRGPNDIEMWGKWVIREVVPPEKLVLVSSFSDANGGTTRHPMAPEWPAETLSTTTFAEHGGKTLMTIRWSPLNATEAERKLFAASHDSMRGGWKGTMEQLEEYLAGAR
jgi:uncharacterized protein YndB with AHSA1/START domain